MRLWFKKSKSEANAGKSKPEPKAGRTSADTKAGYKPAPEALKAEVRAFMDRHNGHLYMPIPHPDFADYPATRGTERFGIIEPHLDHRGGTALDVGTHFGAFAHWLDGLGYKVTAVENSKKYGKVAEGIRDICGKDFKVIQGSVFDIENPKFDIVLALNIFHHFLKKKEKYDALVAFLTRLECETMIFQAHDEAETQMDNAYRNMGPDEFVEFVAKTAGLPKIELIGYERKKRRIFKLSK